MKKILIFLSIVTLLAVVPAAQATSFPATITLTENNHIKPSEVESDDDVEIQLDFFLSGYTLTVDIFNNSNTAWAPSLVGIGFELMPDAQPTIVSWSLVAQTADGNPQEIGSDDMTTGYWTLQTPGSWPGGEKKYEFDYYPTSDTGSDPKDGALYNPDLLISDPALGTLPEGYYLLPGGEDFYTKATLEIIFDTSVTITEITRAGARLQNVGDNGGDSLKLVGDGFSILPGDPGATPTPTPEPATLLLLGTALLAFSGISRKKFKK